LQTPQQYPGIDSAFSGKWRRLDLAMQPDQGFVSGLGHRLHLMSDSTSKASAEFWLGLQSDYELEKTKDELAARIEREVRPRRSAA